MIKAKMERNMVKMVQIKYIKIFTLRQSDVNKKIQRKAVFVKQLYGHRFISVMHGYLFVNQVVVVFKYWWKMHFWPLSCALFGCVFIV